MNDIPGLARAQARYDAMEPPEGTECCDWCSRPNDAGKGEHCGDCDPEYDEHPPTKACKYCDCHIAPHEECRNERCDCHASVAELRRRHREDD